MLDVYATQYQVLIPDPRVEVYRQIRRTYGSDSGMSPWLIFNVMTDSKNPQAVSTEAALRTLTIGSSYAEFQEKRKGTLKSGSLADIAVLSQDVSEPAAVPVMATHSALTIVGGKVAFQTPELKITSR